MKSTMNMFIPAPGEDISENDRRFLLALKNNLGESAEAYQFIDTAIVAYLRSMNLELRTVYMDDYSEDREDIDRLEKSINDLSIPLSRLTKWTERIWELRRTDFSSDEIAVARELADTAISATSALKADYDEMRGESRVLEIAAPLNDEFKALRKGFEAFHRILAAA